MRDLLIVAALVAVLPFIFRRPVYGYFAWVVVSLASPHQLAYGFAREFPFSMVIAVATVISVVLSREKLVVSHRWLFALLLCFAAWFTLTTFVAQAPEAGWKAWDRNVKTLGFTLLGMLLVRTEQDARALVYVAAASLAFYGFKGGLFTLASGGRYTVFGPDNSFIADNNSLALALVATLPLIAYVSQNDPRKAVRVGGWFAFGLTFVSVLGSFSRGALLALGVMGAVLLYRSTKRVALLAVALAVVPAAISFMPDRWFERMATIDDYKEDASTQGRFMSWRAATNVANDYLRGGGFDYYENADFYFRYTDAIFDSPKSAHSIYFQVLGEHGYVGLALFLCVFAIGWFTAGRVRSFALRGAGPQTEHLAAIAAAAAVSLVAYMAGGAFLNMAYYDLPYVAVVVIAACRFAASSPPERVRSAVVDWGIVGHAPIRASRPGSRAGGKGRPGAGLGGRPPAGPAERPERPARRERPEPSERPASGRAPDPRRVPGAETPAERGPAGPGTPGTPSRGRQ